MIAAMIATLILHSLDEKLSDRLTLTLLVLLMLFPILIAVSTDELAPDPMVFWLAVVLGRDLLRADWWRPFQGLLLAIAAALAPGKRLFVQSDVLAVIEPMLAVIDASGCFTGAGPWLEHIPLPLPTERETYVLAQGLPVYRVLYQRNHQLPPTEIEREERLEQMAQAADNPPEPSALLP